MQKHRMNEEEVLLVLGVVERIVEILLMISSDRELSWGKLRVLEQ